MFQELIATAQRKIRFEIDTSYHAAMLELNQDIETILGDARPIDSIISEKAEFSNFWLNSRFFQAASYIGPWHVDIDGQEYRFVIALNQASGGNALYKEMEGEKLLFLCDLPSAANEIEHVECMPVGEMACAT